jgi:hypothetical protein
MCESSAVPKTRNQFETNPIPDARVRVHPTHKPIIVNRLKNGETQAQVAADYHVTRNWTLSLNCIDPHPGQASLTTMAAAGLPHGSVFDQQ